MSKNNKFQELNADDRRLIAQATSKSKNTVDKVLRGERNNTNILETAEKVLLAKTELSEKIMNETAI